MCSTIQQSSHTNTFLYLRHTHFWFPKALNQITFFLSTQTNTAQVLWVVQGGLH